ncbi:cell division protein ZapA [Parasediminibacterium sp. JCM 36343]|uniref:cell division protein ZapA n=1 Tax=Parasediminibacterium sp. JCM 36343 TaxID=3374279 RepID=UPI00397AA0B9
MSNELITVNIAIADRTYRLKTMTKDEEVLRKTVKLINEKIVEYKTQFAGKDIQDYISMVLIWLATEQTKSADHIIEIQDALDTITTLENQLERALTTEITI